MKLRPAVLGDAPAIAAVYAPFVADTAFSLELEPPSAEAMVARMVAGEGRYPWLVALDDEGKLSGYAYATEYKAREGYRFTVETSVYVAPDAQRKGLGTALLGGILDELERRGFAQAIATITLPNSASIILHEQFGFVAAGVLPGVGFKAGGWRDVGLWRRGLSVGRREYASSG